MRAVPVQGDVPYPLRMQALLRDHGIEEGDEILIEKEGTAYRGILMPHHAFSGEEILTIKLSNGYNVGIQATAETKIELVAKGEIPTRRTSALPQRASTSLRQIGAAAAPGTRRVVRAPLELDTRVPSNGKGERCAGKGGRESP